MKTNSKYKQYTILFLLAVCAILLTSCTATTGTLEVGIESSSSEMVVESTKPVVETVPSLATMPPTETATVLPTAVAEAPDASGSQYWTVYQDPTAGFRFAVPCFWRVEFPVATEGLPTSSVYHAFNYSQEYLALFPRNHIPEENGAINVSFDLIDIRNYDLPSGSSLREFVAMENSSGDVEVIDIVDETINGQPAISVTTNFKELERIGRYSLIKISDDLFLRFSVFPSPKLFDTPDINGIFHSIMVDATAVVPLPTHLPAPPPVGVAAPCLES